MKLLHAGDSIAIPEGVKVELKNRVVRVTGPRGVLTRDFRHLNLDMAVIGGKVQVELWEGTRKTIARVRTVLSEIKNLMVGVTKGYKYKMRSVYAHFPIVCAISDDAKTVEVRNFLGEKRARVVALREGVTAKRSENVKDEISIEGNDLDSVGLSAAMVQQIARVRNKDIRKFLDGVYVSERGHIQDE